MAKKHDYSSEYEQIVDNTTIIPIEIENEMKKSFMAYAMAVNVSRAIPDVRDGMKPVHRRILYAMYEDGLTSDKPFRKCATTVGSVLGRYHPHGDSAVYGALVRLAQDFSIRCPLIEGHGNFGSVDGDPPAAYRYTESRLSKIASEMLRDIDKNTVDFVPNFDSTRQQPTVLPSRFPNLLVNGSDGIAVGMATNIPPHNLGEVIDATVALLHDEDITIEELIKILPAPDYPTGGLILGTKGIENAYTTGKGNIVVRARTEIEDDGNRSRIIVSEIPYQVNKAELIIAIADLVKNKRIEGVSDIKEESDKKGMRIVIEIKNNYQPQVVLNYLFKHTSLQTSYGVTFLALDNGTPKIMNLKQMLSAYVDHQKSVVTRRTRFDLNRAEEREHIVKGLVVALANIDEVIKIIKSSTDRQDASTKLQESFLLSDKQANAILDMRLQRLTSLEVEKLKEEQEQLLKTIVELRGILASDEKIKNIIATELLEIKEKYGEPRKSEITLDYSNIDIGDLIEKEDVVISMTHFGYIKRLPVDEYKSQHRGGMGVTAHKAKEEDFVENLFISNTHDDIMFFSNFGKVYTIKGYEIPEGQKQAKGRAVVNLLEVADGEKINTIMPMPKQTEGYLVIATKSGMIKKTDIKEYMNIRKSGKIAISLAEGDELISVQFSKGDDEILVASNEGKCIKFSENDVRPLGRDTMGVKAIDLADDDYLVDMIVLKPDTQIITVSSNGYGKRSPQSEYRLQNRRGKGVKAGVFNAKTGRLVNLKQATEDEDIMMIADNGIIIRTPAKDISVIGRDTVGVKIMRLKDGAKVTCVAIADHIAEDLTDDGDLHEDIEIKETYDSENSDN